MFFKEWCSTDRGFSASVCLCYMCKADTTINRADKVQAAKSNDTILIYIQATFVL